MSRHLFDIDQMILARAEFIREARELPLGAERNQKRQVARSLKRLIQTQAAARDSAVKAESGAVQRRRFKQTAPLDQRLSEQAARLRKEAQGTPPGVERDTLLRRARQAEEAVQMQEWLVTSGTNAPK